MNDVFVTELLVVNLELELLVVVVVAEFLVRVLMLLEDMLAELMTKVLDFGATL